MAKKAYVGAPETFEVLEYIQCTGTQYIDTEYSPKSDNVIYECSWVETVLNTGSSIFGSTNTSSSTNKWTGVHYHPSAGAIYSATGSTDGVCSASGIAANVMNTLTTTIKNGVVTMVRNGATYTGNYIGSIQNGISIALFADKRNSDVVEWCNNLRLYYWRMTDNNTLVRDMIPVKRSNGAVGMYDRVNSVFYGNAGTGEFIAGSATGEVITAPSVARKIKKGYVGVSETFEVLEYIESTGTQHIDTGFTPNQDTRVYAECVFATASSTQGLFGARTSSSANQYQFVTSGNYYRSDYNTTTHNVTNTSYGTSKFYVDKSKNAFDLNGDHFSTQTYAAFTCPCPMYIFATNNNGSVYAQATAKLYVFRVYDNSTLVRNMTPVKRGLDGAVGMYDRVHGVFYGNVGTGVFVAGAATGEVINASSTARKIKKGYVGIGGVARPFWSGGELAYYGTITPLSVARYCLAATHVGNYALFGGGYNTSNMSDVVDAYDTKLTLSKPTALSTARMQAQATHVGNYALFGGGAGMSSTRYNRVDCYNKSLVRSISSLSSEMVSHAATHVGDYALFGGGIASTILNIVNAFNTSLTRTTPTALGSYKRDLCATHVGDYAVFSSGQGNSYQYLLTMDAYNKSLTKTAVSDSSVCFYTGAATHVGDYALFAGGSNSGGVHGTVNAYNKSLTRSVPTALSYSMNHIKATCVENFALFEGGGYALSSSIPTTANAYDESLTRTIPTPLGAAIHTHAATHVGNYALFGGGSDKAGTYQSGVYAYVVA